MTPSEELRDTALHHARAICGAGSPSADVLDVAAQVETYIRQGRSAESLHVEVNGASAGLIADALTRLERTRGGGRRGA